MSNLAFDNSYARLPDRFFSRQMPTPVSTPELIRVNESLAALLQIDMDWLNSSDGIEVLAGNRIPDGADPIATVYAGHQFGNWNPQLGDGRAILLGEVIGTDQERYDLQLKGAGQTPYSRMGDGRAPLGPVLREYVVSEAMAALGIATSRSLAAVSTGDPVYREEALPGAVLARVARSHIRIGTVQLLAAREDVEGLKLLVEHVIHRHYPDAADAEIPALAMFDGILRRQASLVASWQGVGFIHGVMNTDNMLLSGETIDYGPCAFMDYYDPAKVYSSIDHGGRYAYRNQPGIANWNLACLAQALIPLVDTDEEKAIGMIREVLERFPAYFLDENLKVLRAKLGLGNIEESDEQLARDFLDLLEQENADITLAFRRLTELADDATEDEIREHFDFGEAFDEWLTRWRSRIETSTESPQAIMLKANPFLIPRNHQIEFAIMEATAGDFSRFHRLCDALADPFTARTENMDLALPPLPEETVRQTFCGT